MGERQIIDTLTKRGKFIPTGPEVGEHERIGPQPTFVRDFLCRFDAIFTLRNRIGPMSVSAVRRSPSTAAFSILTSAR
jgi:hypothetical protein